jgi:type III restriction enzyme
MDNVANTIRQRLSLRKPLAEALELTARIVDKLSLGKPAADENEKKEFLKEELAKVKEVVPFIKDFERDFPSLAFSIATGIGKTRLMGAIIAYLYLKKGIKHFFILAPNLTLYEKLKKDFGDTSYEKYVFKGISEFVTRPPVVVTGENYNQHNTSLFSDLEINIFNISKFNSDSKDSKKGVARMRRLSEYLGQSYFDYLAGLDDLVILMDEAHRYHADASKKAINELRPILGCEMTATPLDEKDKPFKNIVFEYNLAQALEDKRYIKDPTVAFRKNFDKASHTRDEVETAMIEDGITIHERTKSQIELYAKQTGQRVVHPFILIACRDITHATQIKELIESDAIFHGKYRGKVLQIDSSTKKEDDIEQQFIGLESPDNKIEIVVHVNMLKEGWDVNNLYTIIPLRAADAVTLVEQTIGRGLRLPYGGERTGNPDVDKLTVIAHDNFSRIIEEAQKGSSILNKLSFVEIDEEDSKEKKGEVVKTKTSVEERVLAKIEQKEAEHLIEKSQYTSTAVEAVVDAIQVVCESVQSYGQLSDDDVKAKIEEKAIENIKESARKSGSLFAEEEVKEQIKQVKQVVTITVDEYKNNAIEIPRVVVEQPEVSAVFEDFDLDTSKGYNLNELPNEIMRVSLATGDTEVFEGKSGSSKGNPVKLLVAALIDFDDIDYDDVSELLHKLATQAVNAIKSNSPEVKSVDELTEKVYAYRQYITNDIYRQMKAHFHTEVGEYRITKVLPHVAILDQHLIKNEYGYRVYSEVPSPLSWVKKYLFKGYRKSYYTEYRFDSGTELDFAYILETDKAVKKWLRPVPDQFNIYWNSGARKYEPDFIVETDDAIYMCETKKASDVSSVEVQAKAEAARQYCRVVSEYNAKNGGKPWRYVIVPHDKVQRNSTFAYILSISQQFN